MNTLLVLVYAAGALGIAIACLRYLEDRKGAPPISRFILLTLVVIALSAAFEAASCHHPQRPWAAVLMLILGGVALWRAFMPAATGIGDLWSRWRPHSHPPENISPHAR